jgi:hypothetical protein
MPKATILLGFLAVVTLTGPAHAQKGGVPQALENLAEQGQTSSAELIEALAAQTEALLASLAALAPAPSDLVVLDAGLQSDTCANPVDAATFDTRLLPDGSEEPFEIPDGKILVVTDIELLGFGGPAGVNNQIRIFTGIGLSKQIVATREATLSPDGRVFHVLQFNSGIVVPPGGEVCMNSSSNLTLTGRLRGVLRDAP